MKSVTQTEQVLDELKAGHSITPLGALSKFRIMRLAPRILELREAGYRITTNTVKRHGKQYASYAMRDCM